MAKIKIKHNLFVYGTLMDQKNFRIITGKTLPQKEALLSNYHKIDLRRAYPFIVPREKDKVTGFVIMGLTKKMLTQIDKYEDEGNLYFRKKVNIVCDKKKISAYTYVGNLDVIWKHFDIDEEKHQRIEHYIEKEMEEFIQRHLLARKEKKEQKFLPLESRAQKECIGRTVKELVQTRIKSPDISVFTTKYGLETTVIPSLKWIKEDKQVFPYIESYIKLIVKQVVFNQIEDRIREDFSNKVAIKFPFYEHAISSLISFTYINSETSLLNMMLKSLGIDQYRPEFDYHDYIIGAILAADELYDNNKIRPLIDWQHENIQEANTPLGVELEFSNIGYLAIGASPGQDPLYDSFFYFDKFDLHRRFWKLGAHIDDHALLTVPEKTNRGFLELALGRYKILEDISVPVATDPWLLSQLIDQAVKFIDVKPHSLHISIQITDENPQEQIRNPEHLICLLMLGGDLHKDFKGILRERRIYQQEITNNYTGISYSRLNSHRADEISNKTQQVIEYQFPRLFYAHDYQSLIIALKGFQLSYNPAPLDLSPECPHLSYNKEIEKLLLCWAEKPQPISEKTINSFIQEIAQGLENEQKTGNGHNKKYIADSLLEIRRKLAVTNQYIKEHNISNGGS